MPIEKYSKEYKDLEESLLDSGFVNGVETLLFMWTEKREELKSFLISRGFKNLGTDDGVDWLYQGFGF